MSEKLIKKKATKELEQRGWTWWCPAKVKWQESDIFGVFDCVAVKGSVIRFIQWTTKSNVSARKKKINRFYLLSRAKISSEIWAWNDKTKRLDKYILNG